MEKVKSLIKNTIFKYFEEDEIKQENSIFVEYYVKSSVLVLEGQKITTIPISYGFEKNAEFSGKVLSLERFTPGLSVDEKLKNKILFIKHLNHYDIKYIVNSKPAVVLTTSDIKRPLYIKDFPIFKVPFPFLGNEKVKVFLKVKEEEEILENRYIDIGFGNYYVYLHFPYDPRFQEPEDLNFYASFYVLKEVIDRLVNIGYPRGFKTRILLTEGKFSNYSGLQKFLAQQDEDKIISIVNIDSCGLGNEKLITKSINKYLIDEFHIKKVSKLMKDLGVNLQKESLKEYMDFSFLNIPMIWFFSQPNIHLYELTSDFINEKDIKEFSSYVSYLLNNLYKEMV